jgi:hypothetical protein
MQRHCYERQGNCVIENERCIFLLFKTRNNIYASDKSAEMLSQLRIKYLHQKTCNSILKLERAKRVKMADILSKINSKDTFEILGCSAPNVFENRKHTHSIRRRRRVQVLKKEISVNFFFFFLWNTPTDLQKIFQRTSCCF